MKIRAISPTVVKYASRERWYEKWEFLVVLKYRMRDIGYRIYNIIRRRHSTVRMKALKWGQWYDSDIRIFEANFQILVEYVEHELAWMYAISINKTGWRHRWYRKRHAREMALKHLNWEMQLGDDSPGQSEAAKKVRDLYLWYKDELPQRKEPWEFTEEEKRWERMRPRYELFNPDNEELDEDEATALKDYRKALQKASEREQAHEDEDTQKLVELIQIRNMMWT